MEISVSSIGAVLGYSNSRSRTEILLDLVYKRPRDEDSVPLFYYRANLGHAIHDYQEKTGDSISQVGDEKFENIICKNQKIAGRKVVLIKIPFSHKGDPKLPHIDEREDWYAEAQYRMKAAGLFECDVYVWSAKASIIYSVALDPYWIEGHQESIKMFIDECHHKTQAVEIDLEVLEQEYIEAKTKYERLRDKVIEVAQGQPNHRVGTLQVEKIKRHDGCHWVVKSCS